MGQPDAASLEVTRGDQFLRLYNELDHHLTKLTKTGGRASFDDKLVSASQLHSVVRERLFELQQFGRLRNLIAHTRGYVLASWAEPTDEALVHFRTLVESIVHPEPLLPRFERDVRVFAVTTPLVEALAYMRDNDYSQIVVKDQEAYRLLSTEGIARWIEHSYEGDLISVRDATVVDAAAFEPDWTVVRLARKATVEDARQVFLHSLNPNRRRVFAVLVTASGRPNERPLGIVTPWDF